MSNVHYDSGKGAYDVNFNEFSCDFANLNAYKSFFFSYCKVPNMSDVTLYVHFIIV